MGKEALHNPYVSAASRVLCPSPFILIAMSAYVEHKTLTGEHCDCVNSVAFSQDGKYLASASSDCSVCIWKVSDGSFLFRVVFESAVNTLLWHPIHKENLICGCEDGSVLSMRNFTPVRSIIISDA